MRKLGLGKKKKKKKKGDKDDRSDKEMKADLSKGISEATKFVKEGGHDKKEIKKKLDQVEDVYDLVELRLIVDRKKEDGSEEVHVHGEVNPIKDGDKVEITPEKLPVKGKVLLIYHEKYGRMQSAHYQAVTSNGTVYDLSLDSSDKIAIRVFSLLKGKEDKKDYEVKGTEFKEIKIDQEKLDKVNPFDEEGKKKIGKDKPNRTDTKKFREEKKRYESGTYEQNTFDCFSFAIEFVNKVINLKNVGVFPKGAYNPDKFDDI